MAVQHHQAPQRLGEKRFNRAKLRSLELVVRLLLRVVRDINNFNSSVLQSDTKADALELRDLLQKHRRQT